MKTLRSADGPSAATTGFVESPSSAPAADGLGVITIVGWTCARIFERRVDADRVACDGKTDGIEFTR